MADTRIPPEPATDGTEGVAVRGQGAGPEDPFVRLLGIDLVADGGRNQPGRKRCSSGAASSPG